MNVYYKWCLRMALCVLIMYIYIYIFISFIFKGENNSRVLGGLWRYNVPDRIPGIHRVLLIKKIETTFKDSTRRCYAYIKRSVIGCTVQ